MSKHTTTLMDILRSELIKKGENEFINDGRLTFFDDKYAFIEKVAKFDDDVYDIVTKHFFGDLSYPDETIDRNFKQAFTNRFMDRQIGRQTLEAFQSQVVTLFIQYSEYIYYTFGQLDSFIENKQTSETHSDEQSKETSDYRGLEATLPQTEINLDVTDDDLNYADTNNINKRQDKGNRQSNSNSENRTFNPDNLEKVFLMKERIMNKFDQKCFLQIW